jgi:hypothetical protein
MNSQAARNLSNRLPFSLVLHFGLRWQSRAGGSDTALVCHKPFDHVTPCESAVAAALCRRTPICYRVFRPSPNLAKRLDCARFTAAFPPSTKRSLVQSPTRTRRSR